MTAHHSRSRWRSALSAIAVGALLAAISGVGSSQAQTASPSNPAAIAVFELEGDAASGELRDALTGAMREQVQSNGRYELVNDNPVVLSDVVVVLGCDSASTTCLGKAADHFGADYLIFGKFEDVGGRNRVSVRLFDPARGRYVRSFGRVLEKLSPPYQSFRDEVDALLKTDRQRESERSDDQGAALRVGANVEEARVRLNGELVGKTPMERHGVSPGEYRVEVTRPGYETWESVVEIGKGDEIEVQATLAPEGDTSSEGTSSTDAGASPDEVEPAGGSAGRLPPSARTAKAADWGPWVAIGIGGASFVASGIQWMRSAQRRRELEQWRQERDIPPRDDCEVEVECQYINEGRNLALSHRILIGVGGVTATGGLLWLLFRNTGGEDGAEARRWNVTFSGNGIGASWRW